MSNVQYLTPKRSIGELNRAARRSSSAQAVAEIMFVKMAQEQQLDETTISEYPDLFTPWDENWRGKAGDIVQDEGQLYRWPEYQALGHALHVDAHRQPPGGVPGVDSAYRGA